MYAWQRATSGSSWQDDAERFGGLLGWARAVEVTDGDNGWHVHVHVLLCFREEASADLARAALGPRRCRIEKLLPLHQGPVRLG